MYHQTGAFGKYLCKIILNGSLTDSFFIFWVLIISSWCNLTQCSLCWQWICSQLNSLLLSAGLRNIWTSTARPVTMATLYCPSDTRRWGSKSTCTSFSGNNRPFNLLCIITWLPHFEMFDCIFLSNSPSIRTPSKTIYDKISLAGLTEFPSVPQLAKVMIVSCKDGSRALTT